MAKKLNWLDQFAQEQYSKEMQKRASLKKVAEEQIIVNPEDVPGAADGQTVNFNGEDFEVVNANYSDEMGPGVVLQAKVAAYEGLEKDPMGMSMGVPATSVAPAPAGQQYHYTNPGDVYQTYTNDEDAQWGSSSASATAQEIAGENATDRTTVPGHYTKSPGLNTAPAVPATPAVPGATPAPAATPVAPAAPAATPVVDAVPAAPVVDNAAPATETPAVEDKAVDAPATEEVKVDEENKDEKKVANRILARMMAKQG